MKCPWLLQRTSSGEDPALQQTGQRVREAYRQVIEPDSDEIQEEMVQKFYNFLDKCDIFQSENLINP